MKTNEIILENDTRTKEFFRKQDKTLYTNIIKFAPEALAALKKGHAIYKGFDYKFSYESSVLITDPKRVIRKSANTTNQYTLLFSNLPSWASYPKRNQSIIATTSLRYASGYGNAYLVLPFDGAKIGVCSGSDMWDTFYKNLGNNTIEMFASFLQLKNISGDTYKKLISEIFYKRKHLGNGWTWRFTPKFAQDLASCSTESDVISLLSLYLQPKSGGFKLTTISHLPKENREVWFDSKAFLIKVHSDFYRRYFPETADFLY
jgi:hypothetical protein